MEREYALSTVNEERRITPTLNFGQALREEEEALFHALMENDDIDNICLE